jgi:hypothetical protein
VREPVVGFNDLNVVLWALSNESVTELSESGDFCIAFVGEDSGVRVVGR